MWQLFTNHNIILLTSSQVILLQTQDEIGTGHWHLWRQNQKLAQNISWQICHIYTWAHLTSAPFIYLNKITIWFIALRGKTSQVWNWSPILLDILTEEEEEIKFNDSLLKHRILYFLTSRECDVLGIQSMWATLIEC